MIGGRANARGQGWTTCRPCSLRALLAYIAVICIILGAVVSTLRWASRQTLQSGCDGRLGAIALALHQYHQDYGCFPPAYIADARGKPVHSWRLLVLASADYPAKSVYDSYNFDETWDSPNNNKLAASMAEFYTCPNQHMHSGSTLTNYVVIVGPGTVFPGARPTALTDARDSPNHTILIAEVADSGINWMEPRDLELSRMSFLPNDPSRPSISSRDPGGPGIVLADGTRMRLGKHSSSGLIKTMAVRTKNGVTNKP